MEYKALAFIVAFIAFLGFMSTIAPPEFVILKPFDFIWFAGSFIGLTTVCVVATGIPCAGGIVVFGMVSLYQYFIVSVDMIKLLVFTPLLVVLIYIAMRLAKGGG
jgi:hypothetical protein